MRCVRNDETAACKRLNQDRVRAFFLCGKNTKQSEGIFLTFLLAYAILVITVTVIGGAALREHIKGGALTEVTFLILLSLDTPRHGYAVMRFIEEKTEGRLVLGAGTLYGALTALQEKGWITLYAVEESGKKTYRMTETGRMVLQKERMRLYQLIRIADDVMGGWLE